MSNPVVIVLPCGVTYCGQIVAGEAHKKGKKRKLRLIIELDELPDITSTRKGKTHDKR